MNSSLLISQRFNATLLQVIDNALEEILGSESKKEFFLYLQSVLLIDREDIPKELENFQSSLHKIFGASASLIENAIVKRIISQFRDYKINIDEFNKMSLTDIVKHCRTLIQLKIIE